jgi:hypothetical protein
MHLPLATALALLAALPAMADIEARFVEGAPKDRFILTNTGPCALPATRVTIDLDGSAGGLIFDVTGSGAGVEVFQPFDLVTGAEFVSARSQVRDGDRSVTLELTGLGAGAEVSFTIDVDDTAGTREITVAGSEIAGASLRVEAAEGQSRAVFSSAATATASLIGCVS